MIEARGLTRRYGEFTAVRDISFSVADGEILGILGPNGAGKTTTIRMITGFLPPSSGRVSRCDQALLSQSTCSTPAVVTAEQTSAMRSHTAAG